jgi:hypothetical protein
MPLKRSKLVENIDELGFFISTLVVEGFGSVAAITSL